MFRTDNNGRLMKALGTTVGWIAIIGLEAPVVAQPASSIPAEAPSIVGEWRPSDGSTIYFVVRRMGRGFDVEWVGQGLGYTLLEANSDEFRIQLDQGLQQTFVTCGLTNNGQGLLCRSRFVQEGRNVGMSDPFTYRRAQ